MYLLGEALKGRVRAAAEEAAQKSDGEVSLEEYIALPFAGQIILRFALDKDRVSLDELDRYENMLYDVVGDEFLIDFMGSVYQKVGLEGPALEERLTLLAPRVSGERIYPSIHRDGIQADAEMMLKAAGLAPSEKVWEIQSNDGEFMLLLMGDRSRMRQVFDSPIWGKTCVGEVPEAASMALVRAAFYAKRNRISLARVLLET